MPSIPIYEWIQALGGFYDRYGYLVVFLGTFGENTSLLGLLLPGNTLALLGAFYARQGTLSIGLVILFATLGTIAGYHVDYLVGRLLLNRFSDRWSASPLGKKIRLGARLRLTQRFLKKNGGKAILLSHTIGHMRSFVAMSAGMTRMAYPRFLAYEVVAATLWNTLFSLIGYFVAVEVEQLQYWIERFGWVMLALFVLLFLGWRYWRSAQRRARQKAKAQRRIARSLL